MEFADYFTPFGGLPPADATGICATGTATSLCSPTTFPGTLSITGATGMIAFTGTAASSITNASTAGTQFGCSTTAATCYTFLSPASGASDTVDVQASTGSGYALQLAGTQAFRVSSNTPTLQNNGAACTICFNFDEKNQPAANAIDFQVDDAGTAGFSVVSKGTVSSYVSIGNATDTGAGTNSILFAGANAGIQDNTACAPGAATNAVPEVATATNQLACVFTSSAATTHTSFQLTFAGAFSYTTTSPVCIVTMGSVNANNVFVNTVTAAATNCAWTTSAAVAAGTKFDVIWLGGKV